ncbi:unnamed protein product [Trichobilharzia regenti]|nr:unnamed protein product [Trichobilharzia regenti]
MKYIRRKKSFSSGLDSQSSTPAVSPLGSPLSLQRVHYRPVGCESLENAHPGHVSISVPQSSRPQTVCSVAYTSSNDPRLIVPPPTTTTPTTTTINTSTDNGASTTKTSSNHLPTNITSVPSSSPHGITTNSSLSGQPSQIPLPPPPQQQHHPNLNIYYFGSIPHIGNGISSITNVTTSSVSTTTTTLTSVTTPTVSTNNLNHYSEEQSTDKQLSKYHLEPFNFMTSSCLDKQYAYIIQSGHWSITL